MLVFSIISVVTIGVMFLIDVLSSREILKAPVKETPKIENPAFRQHNKDFQEYGIGPKGHA